MGTDAYQRRILFNNINDDVTNTTSDANSKPEQVIKKIHFTTETNKSQINTLINSSFNGVIDENLLKEQIKSCDEESTYLFCSVEQHETRAKELFDRIAKQEVKKRLLEKFYNKLRELKKISDTSKQIKAKEKLDKEFRETLILSDELDNYTQSSATKEFLLNILTLDDLKQIKLACFAALGSKKMINSILKSHIGLFELYIDNRAEFVSEVIKLSNNNWNSAKNIREEFNKIFKTAV